jgi:hypothetical protein
MDRRLRIFVLAGCTAVMLLAPLSAPRADPATPTEPSGEWLAGDLHVHTCYSHDAYCGPSDDNTGPEELYTLSGDVEERFAEAALRGLDYLAITDHNDVRSVDHAGFGAHGVIPIPGYEASLDGHAQILGVRTVLDHGDGPAAISALAAAAREAGGLFQINHAGAAGMEALRSCAADDLTELDWGYGTAVVPDTVEVWNIGHYLHPPLPVGTSNDDSERLWECFLAAGHRVGATGGSDTHWLATSALQGVGNPTTWVLAGDRSATAVLDGLRSGRTTISMLPPAAGGAPLLLEADRDGDGVYESTIGDTVAPGTAMRVRSANGVMVGLLSVRANGRTLVEAATASIGPGLRFRAPASPGWVRASLLVVPAPTALDPLCRAFDGTPLTTSYCRNRLVVAALTSPIYVRR